MLFLPSRIMHISACCPRCLARKVAAQVAKVLGTLNQIRETQKDLSALKEISKREGEREMQGDLPSIPLFLAE